MSIHNSFRVKAQPHYAYEGSESRYDGANKQTKTAFLKTSCDFLFALSAFKIYVKKSSLIVFKLIEIKDSWLK